MRDLSHSNRTQRRIHGIISASTLGWTDCTR
jgi:hypothetical protein